MRAKQFFRFLESARRDASASFREHFRLRNGATVVCKSKSEYDFWESFSTALADGSLTPNECSIRDIFENCFADGREIAQSWAPNNGGGVSLMEAGDAVSSGDFANITGQIVFTRLIEDMMAEDFKFTALIPTTTTQFNGEKIAGITGLGDDVEVVNESDPYPLVGVSEDYIETPVTTKRGMIVPITKEAIFFDRTGDLLRKAGMVGQSLGINKEKRAIDCVIDENRTIHRYKWRGTSYATYQTTTPWDNVTASNALVDWTDIDNADQTLNGITDPHTGEPVVVEPTHVIVTKQLEQVANRIRNATEVTVTTPGFATSANPSQAKIANPMGGKFEVLSSRQLAARSATDTTWLYGAPAKAFTYMENWGITVVQAPPNSTAEFERDIVTQFKCSERGEYTTLNPRLMVENTA